MTVSCCAVEPEDWAYRWYTPSDMSVPAEAEHCHSCRSRIAPRQEAWQFLRDRVDEDGELEPISPWWLCEPCGDLVLSLAEAGYCLDMSMYVGSVPEQWREYQETET